MLKHHDARDPLKVFHFLFDRSVIFAAESSHLSRDALHRNAAELMLTESVTVLAVV